MLLSGCQECGVPDLRTHQATLVVAGVVTRLDSCQGQILGENMHPSWLLNFCGTNSTALSDCNEG